MILELAVVAAELGAAAFFVAFCWLALGLEREGRDLPKPQPDAVGDALVASARLAMLAGYGVFFALTVYVLILELQA